MSAIFPKWTHRLPAMVITAFFLVGSVVTAGVWYYLTPKYTEVGYRPIQPVAFSHAVHAGQLGPDCRYCYTDVEKLAGTNSPTRQSMNKRGLLIADFSGFAKVRR